MTDSNARLVVQLKEECVAIGAFISLLQQEQEHLVESRTENIAELTERKDAALRHLAEIGAARTAQFVAKGAGTTPESLANWLSGQPLDVQKQWDALMQAAREAQELNRTNGILIGRRISQNQQAIQVLTGSTGEQQFYGPNGQAANRIATRPLVSG